MNIRYFMAATGSVLELRRLLTLAKASAAKKLDEIFTCAMHIGHRQNTCWRRPEKHGGPCFFSDKLDFEEAEKGFIAPFDSKIIFADNGNVAREKGVRALFSDFVLARDTD
jgi:alkyl sulfatase BDS1-like metallo-beta-lactamase superfamily hydrolase